MIIAKYLRREVFTSTTVIAMILLFIFLSNQFVRYISSAANGHLANKAVFSLMLLSVE